MKTPAIRLLLVDDNPVDALLAQRMLQALGDELPISTTWVDNAEKAMTEIREHPYDIVVLDYQLPGATGLDVLTATKQIPQLRRPAVIMLTASGSEKVAVDCMKIGARDYLRKDELAVAPLTRAITSALSQKRLEDQVARYIAQTGEDMKMARQLQHALLPQRFPNFPAHADLEDSALRFHPLYISTAELGGDFYGVLRLSDTEAGVFICDVMGHGVRSALVTAMVRALVEELMPAAGDPGRFLTEMNYGLSAILLNMEDPLFTTAFYLVADIARGRIHYANAGHPAPLHLRTAAGAVESLHNVGDRKYPALGLVDDTHYTTTTIAIEPRDLILLYTDGLVEIANASREEYGHARLEADCRARLGLRAPRLLDELVASAKKFSGDEQFDDDVCLLGIEVARTGQPGKETA